MPYGLKVALVIGPSVAPLAPVPARVDTAAPHCVPPTVRDTCLNPLPHRSTGERTAEDGHFTHADTVKAALPTGSVATPPADVDKADPAASDAAPVAALYRSDAKLTPLAPATMNAPLPSALLPLQLKAVSEAPAADGGVHDEVADVHVVPEGHTEVLLEPSEYCWARAVGIDVKATRMERRRKYSGDNDDLPGGPRAAAQRACC